MTVKKGIDNIRNKLTEADVLDIYHNDELNQIQLGEKYKVSQSTINHIKHGRTWAWLTKHGT